MILLIPLILSLSKVEPYKPIPIQTFEIINVAPAPTESGIAARVNGVRTSRGLPALKSNHLLNKGAYVRAKELCDKKQWSHAGWVETFNKSGYKYTRAGENLAHGFTSDAALVQGWVDSPTHYENIIGDYREQGIGEYTCFDFHGFTKTKIVVNYFGR